MISRKLIGILVVFSGLGFSLAYAVNSLVITGSVTSNVVTIDEPEITISGSGTNNVTNLKLYGNDVLLQSHNFVPPVNVPVDTPTILNHTFGETITIPTNFYENATVLTLTNIANVTNDFQASSAAGWINDLFVEKFTGLSVGATISKLGLNVVSIGTGGNDTHNFSGSNRDGWKGSVYVQKFSPLTAGSTITYLTLNVTGTGLSKQIYNYASDNTNAAIASNAVTRAGVNATVTVPFLNEYVKTVAFKLGKVGSPTGTGYVRIRADNDTVVSEASFDVSTLSTTETLTQFTLNNCVQIRDGYRVLLEYTGGSYPTDWVSLREKVADIPTGFQGLFYSGSYTANNDAIAGNFDSPPATYCGYDTHVRIKIYNDTANDPNQLLGQSGSLTVNNVGLQSFPVSATVPSSGIVWAGFETDFQALDLKMETTAGGAASRLTSHTFGDNPDPFGSVTDNTSKPWMILTTNAVFPHVRVKIYSDDGGGGEPSTLLGESGSLTVSGTGEQLFSVSATVPSSGIVWAGFETDNPLLSLKYTNGAFTSTMGILQGGHVYGSGSNPFGTRDGYTNKFWEQLSLSTQDTTTTIIKSNTLSFSPAFTPTYINNCGLSHCASKLVNYTVTRSLNYSKLTLTVNVIPIPFDIECLMTNGTFTQSSAWHNFTNINALNLTVNVIPNDNAYGICYGSGELLSFRSAGNQSDIVTGANVLSGSFGAMLGVPIGTFVVVMIASLASQRTAPIYVVIVLAVIGIMSTISFFTLQSGIWAMVLIAGMLGLFVGRKVF